jgi:HEAT repeat protein
MEFFKPNIEKMKANGDVEGLIKALKDKDEGIRAGAALALVEVELEDASAARALAQVVKEDESTYVRNVAQQALAMTLAKMERTIAQVEGKKRRRKAKD